MENCGTGTTSTTVYSFALTRIKGFIEPAFNINWCKHLGARDHILGKNFAILPTATLKSFDVFI